MEDRFRFRAYNRELRKMYEVDTICPYEDNHTKGGEVFLKGIQYNSFYFPEEVEVMQCTGLKDKKGKLIYEGDIIKIGNGSVNGSVIETTREVKWTINTWNVPVWVVDKPNFSHYVEVIGNIYENPELLED